MKKLIKAVFFDLDNTLVDGLKCHHIANVEAFKVYGLDYEKALMLTNNRDFFGMRMCDILAACLNALGITDTSMLSNLMIARERNFLRYAKENGVILLSGAEAALKTVKEKVGIAAIVSSATQEYIEFVLDRYRFHPYVDFIVDASDVENGKPAPDCYNKAYEMLPSEKKITRGECLVVEDAVNGVRAAEAAGMRVLLVPSRPEQDTEKLADWTCGSLEEFTTLPFL